MPNTIDQDSRFVYVPPGDGTLAISSMVEDLNNRALKLDKTYVDSVRMIQNTIYDHNNDDLILKQMLDDARNEQKKQDEIFFRNYQEEQNKSIKTLMSDALDIHNIKNNLEQTPPTLNKIKSFYNQNLAVTPVKNSDTYLINVNYNCLSMDPTNNNFSLKKCDPNSTNQLFRINNINDEITYFQMYGTTPNVDTLSQFPYNVVKSTVANYCLNDTKNGISLTPCKSLDGQKWVGFKNAKNKCLQNK